MGNVDVVQLILVIVCHAFGVHIIGTKLIFFGDCSGSSLQATRQAVFEHLPDRLLRGAQEN